MTARIAPSLLLLLCAPLRAADDPPPQWLKDAAAQTHPAYPANVPAVVLLDEQSTTVQEDGLVVERRTKALKILNSEGRSEAVAAESYIQKAGKVREIRAWLIESGVPKFYGKSAVSDRALIGQGSIYDEYRLAMINASGDARPGAVFGFEILSESRSVFTQFTWAFQDNLPALLSRYRLTLPAGWEVKSAMLRHPEVKPSVEGNTYTWQLVNLPFIDAESSGPSVRSLVPRLSVGYLPSGGRSLPVRVIRDWSDVSSWMSELADPSAVPDDAITAKTRELTANAAGEWEKIQALARYVQGIRYISIQTGVAKGGGYKPHLAADIFAKSYGDCKDKAALLRAMLKVIGIESYDVSIYSGDRTYVDDKWATPNQFNHAIVAVKVSDGVRAPAVLEPSSSGAAARLLIFDPTDEDVAPGDLPQHEQGSLALVGMNGSAGLLRMPVLPAASNAVDRKMHVKLSEDGAAEVSLVQTSLGAPGARSRSFRRDVSEADYRKSSEQWISSEAPGAAVGKIETSDNGDSFTLQAGFGSPRYGRRMNTRLLMAKPTPISLNAGPDVSKPTRQRPLLLNARLLTEETTLELPAGFSVDEAPEAMRLETPFGTFEASSEMKGTQLITRRRLELKHMEVPAASYTTLRDFLITVNGHSNAVAVFLKK